MNVILLPLVSDIGPQKDGAKPCTTMYTVIVKLTSDKLTLSSFIPLAKTSTPAYKVETHP